MVRVAAVGWPVATMFVGALAVAFVGVRVGTEGPQQPGTVGQRIEVHDGDVILIRDDARVRIVRRREGNVRVVFNRAQRWLVLLMDDRAPNGPDGRVDSTYLWNGIAGEWPLGDRWEGPVAMEDYLLAGEPVRGFGLAGPSGLVQLLASPVLELFRDAGATSVLSYVGASRGSAGQLPFDESERRAVTEARRRAETGASLPSGASLTGAVSLPGVAASSSAAAASSSLSPVRVGGSIRMPRRLVDVAPVLPDQARQAGIRGVVILEVTIDPDGAVSDVRVLRSVPLLDAAATEAARQWRYEPTLLNGQAVSVILTVPVSFQ